MGFAAEPTAAGRPQAPVFSLRPNVGVSFASIYPPAPSLGRLSGPLLYSHPSVVPFSTLSLDWCTREGGSGKARVQYLDFVIDGQSLLDRLPPIDEVGTLGWGPPKAERGAIAQLLLREPSDLLGGRVPLYICPQCGHLDCGSVTAHIKKTADAFVWSDFAWEVTYEFEPGDEGILRRYEGIGPFVFSKSAYLETLSGRLNQVAV